jgi:hypothetical protein
LQQPEQQEERQAHRHKRVQSDRATR